MDLGLKDKVALVAAASRGLGRAVAEELAAEGASLILCARNAKTLTETSEAISRNSGAHVLAVPADVAVVGDVAKVVETGIKRFGRIDILVTNAGGPPVGNFEVGRGRASHALQCYRIGTSYFAGHERPTLGPYLKHHFHRREAAGGKLDLVK